MPALIAWSRFFVGGLWTLLCWLIDTAASLAGFATWGFPILWWLKDGAWTPLTLAPFYQPASNEWIGIDKIIAWVLDTNCGFVLLPFAITFGVIAQLRMEEAEGR
jgi:hypothetical protein